MGSFWGTSDGANGVGERSVDQNPTRLRTLCLQRLHRLVGLKAMQDLDPSQQRLVNHALYSTYWDCVGIGAQAEASAILRLPRQVRSAG